MPETERMYFFQHEIVVDTLKDNVRYGIVFVAKVLVFYYHQHSTKSAYLQGQLISNNSHIAFIIVFVMHN